MTAALVEAGVARDADVLLADELRLGLRGQVRRVLAPRGTTVTNGSSSSTSGPTSCWRSIREPGPCAGAGWSACAPARSRRRWPIGRSTPSSGTASSAHRARLLADLPTARVRLPPYSPELNPAERVFEEIRRRSEGRVYDTVADKQAVADAYLAELAADPARVRRLCGWPWIRDALERLPASASA